MIYYLYTFAVLVIIGIPNILYASHAWGSPGSPYIQASSPPGVTYVSAYGGSVTLYSCPSCSGGSGSSSEQSNQSYQPPPPPPPKICGLSVDKTAIAVGRARVVLTWSPSASGGVSLTRDGINLATTGQNTTSYIDSFTASLGSHKYSLSYNSSGYTYICSTTVRAKSPLTECNDEVDNADAEDTFADSSDPACHTSKDPYTPSYNERITSETFAVDLVARTRVTTGDPRTGTPLSFYSSVENASAYTTPRAPDTEVLARNMTTRDALSNVPTAYLGSTFYTLFWERTVRLARAVWERTSSFVPPSVGWYQLCTVADRYNAVWESNENNNYDCRAVEVRQGTATNPQGASSTSGGPIIIGSPAASDLPAGGAISPAPTQTFGELQLRAQPLLVRKGSRSNLIWDTRGRTGCRVRGTNGMNVALSVQTGLTPTSALTGETVFTLTCSQDSATKSVTVHITPEFREI